MFYQLFEMNHAVLGPWRAAADAARLYFKNPLNPLAHTHYGRSIAAACEVFERSTRRYGKPEFGLETALVGGTRVAVAERVVWEKPFARLVHFERDLPAGRRPDPKILIVAPMSGHYATLLRGTVEALLPRHEIFITDWIDARMVPLTAGGFDLDDYIDYVVAMLHHLGQDTHIIAVCQPAVPVLAAVSLMEEANDPYSPPSMILMGGPVDTRISPTAVNKMASQKDLDWFRRNVIMQVPFPHPGFMRPVYPGFLQLSGFMSMNLDRHLNAQREFYGHLIVGDGDSAEKHRDFYDEYLAVMDLSAEFYLQTVDTVFIRHSLPLGAMMHRGHRVNPAAIRKTALLTVEGELDDITGKGQTQAAHRLCANIPDVRRADYVQSKVGHYGVFNGSRFRAEIAPRIADFVMTFNRRDAKLSETAGPVVAALKAKDLTPEQDGGASAPAPSAEPAPSAGAAPDATAVAAPSAETASAEPPKPAAARRKPAASTRKSIGTEV
ncbi:MAG: polyhydroxyalkanoate depolymerase [Ancalomicrobiaceae bacterium]|nr:polyhydroxyalkanoate depolymerase [Ancalomicrobiaceae bacterium]